MNPSRRRTGEAPRQQGGLSEEENILQALSFSLLIDQQRDGSALKVLFQDEAVVEGDLVRQDCFALSLGLGITLAFVI